MRLHSYDPRDGKVVHRTSCEGRHRRIIQVVQKQFLRSDPARPKAPVALKTTDLITCATQKSTKRFLREDLEKGYIVVVPELLSKRSRKEQILVQRSKETKNASTLKPRTSDNNKEAQPKSEE